MINQAKENERKYKEYKLEIMKKISSLRKQIEELNEMVINNDVENAKKEFEEAKLLQEYNSLINSYKGYDLTIKDIQFLIQTLEGKKDKFERAKEVNQIKKDKEKLDTETEMIYSRDEIEKCEKAIRLYKMKGEQTKAEEYSKKLDIAQKQYAYAKEEFEKSKQDKNKQNNEKENNNGYSFEQNGMKFHEKQEQILKDYEGNEIGTRTITEDDDLEKGKREIKTIGELENGDGKYSFEEISSVIGEELQYQRKEMKGLNKITGQKEQYTYEKDDKGNERFYQIFDNKISFRITKNNRGITIENYDESGQILDIFEYDENGKPLIAMGEIEQLPENYVENSFDSQVPYFEAENGVNEKTDLKQNILESGVKATEEKTRTSEINKQVENIRNIQKERTEPMRTNDGIQK